MTMRRAALLTACAFAAMGLISSAYAVDTKSHVETNTSRGFRADAKPLSAADKSFIRSEIDKAPKPTQAASATADGAHVDEKVKLYPLPAPAVERVPSYQPYQYFAAAGGKIVIVNPETRIVVETIDR